MTKSGLIVALAGFLVMNEKSSFSQGTTVWHWVPNPQQGYLFPNPIGAPVYVSPFLPMSSVPIDMTGNGTIDFEFRARTGGNVIIEVLQHNTNEVVGTTVPPPDIGEVALAFNKTNQVGPAPPDGTQWLPVIALPPYGVGGKLDSQFTATNQYTGLRDYIGVRFAAADGLHYGALEVIAVNDPSIPDSANNTGIIYGYGYNTVPGVPFELNAIPPEPKSPTLGAQVTNNRFELTIPYVAGSSYIVQANTNLNTTNWVSLATNTAPFTFTDIDLTNYPQRFYRALYNP